MPAIFPPTGQKDESRFRSVKDSDREYMLFCLEFCSEILDKRPTHVEALEVAANHFTELGYFSDGLELDRRLAALRPDDPGILYNLSCSLALVGSREEALATLEKAVDNGYGDHRHMSMDKDLAPIRSEPRFAEILTKALKIQEKD